LGYWNFLLELLETKDALDQMATYHIIESAPRRLLDAVFFEHNRLQCINACDIYCLTGKLKLPKEAVST